MNDDEQLTWFYRLLDERLPKGDYVPQQFAKDHLDFLRENHVGALDAWLHAKALSFLVAEVRDRRGTARRRSRAQALRGEFAEAVKAAEEGDLTPLSVFALTYEVDDKGTQRPVGMMTGDDHRYVADDYSASSRRDAMLASFHRAVAKQVGKRTTAEVLTEEKYLELQDSILKRSA